LSGSQVPKVRKRLARLLRDTDPRAVLVAPRVLRRVIKASHGLGGFAFGVPHQQCYTIERDPLLELVAPIELGVVPDDLQPRLILIPEPPEKALRQAPFEQLLVMIWRALFHAYVDLAFERLRAEGRLDLADVRGRIDRVGQTAFDGAHWVLDDEERLLPPRSEATVYAEFVALYLELRYFAPDLLEATFPSLRQGSTVESVILLDIDPAALLAAARPPGAPESPAGVVDVMVPGDREARPGPVDVGPLQRPDGHRHRKRSLQADRAARRGNFVKAAIRATQAAWAGAGPERRAAERERDRHLTHLSIRLAAAFEETSGQPESWRSVLEPLLDPAAVGILPLEARLLYDLQALCDDAERETYRIDIFRWLSRLGRGSIKRALPSYRQVRILKRARAAADKARTARLDEAARRALRERLRRVAERLGGALRAKFFPILDGVLDEVGLQPQNLPERVARAKMVEELLDVLLERGYLSMGDLRDATARSHIKLPNVVGPHAFLFRDPLLRANRALEPPLDGVYRPAEFYFRWLQRLSALGFGTRLGQWLTRYLVLPLGGAFVVLEGLQHIVGPLTSWLFDIHPHLLTEASFILVALFFFGLLHLSPVRKMVRMAGETAWHLTRAALVDLPRLLVRWKPIQRLLRSRGYRLTRRYLLGPALATLVLVWLSERSRLTGAADRAWVALVTFGAVNLVFNSRPGRRGRELLLDGLGRLWQRTRHELLPNLFRWIMEGFRQLLEWVERGTYAVDEWFRFRSGDRRLTVAAKALFGPIWRVLTYVLRLYVNLLVEPQVNPVKHFPVVTVAAKLILPFTATLTALLATPLAPLGPVAANTIAATTVFLLPGVFGFLAWELQGNWRLFEHNRPKVLKPARIGHHGETMPRFLRPGIHSGTLPKLLAKMRKTRVRGRWRALRRHQRAVHHVETALRHFAERDLIDLLRASGRLGRINLRQVEVELGSHHIALALGAGGVAGEPLVLIFEEQTRYLVAGVARLGWSAALESDERAALRDALTGFYKLSDVDLVREEVARLLPGGASWDVADQGLVAWPTADFEQEVVYPLDRDAWELIPRGDTIADELPRLTPEALFFAARPVSWTRWVRTWEAPPGTLEVPRGEAEPVPLGQPARPPRPAADRRERASLPPDLEP
jgi:hypothetical protein